MIPTSTSGRERLDVERIGHPFNGGGAVSLAHIGTLLSEQFECVLRALCNE
jgi:hypothetical protein